MSSEHRLSVRAGDPTAEITIYDASFNRVARGVGKYDGSHPEGLYEVRVRTAGTQEERLVSLASDEDVDLEPVAFASPVPLDQIADASHRAAVQRAWDTPVSLGAGSGLLIVARDTIGSKQAMGSPAAGLSLLGSDGGHRFDIAVSSQVDSSGPSPLAAVFLKVDPGVYRLRLTDPDGEIRERSLVASARWTSRYFMFRRFLGKRPVADIASGSLSLTELGRPFAADGERTRLSEAAADALANDRKVTVAATNALLDQKFADPMLGLLVGHLLLRDQPGAPILKTVVANLIRLLGEEHPDVQALMVASSSGNGPSTIRQMPMLRASWDVIIAQTAKDSSLLPGDSPAGQVSAHVLPSAPWLIWEVSTRRVDAKMAALRGFLSQPSQPALEGATRSVSFSGPATASTALDAGPAPASTALDADAREELMRSLGVPSSVLDQMLSSLDK